MNENKTTLKAYLRGLTYALVETEVEMLKCEAQLSSGSVDKDYHLEELKINTKVHAALVNMISETKMDPEGSHILDWELDLEKILEEGYGGDS